MASDVGPGAISSASAVLSIQSAAATAAAATATAATAAAATTAGHSAPQSGDSAKQPAPALPTAGSGNTTDPTDKNLNDSGRPDQFRLSPDSDKYIQQVNPSTGAVVAEYSVDEFPALARSIGLLIDDIA